MAAPDPVIIINLLRGQYDLPSHASEFLHFDNPYEILIATILSAQTTDKTVNIVTRELFARYPDVSDLASANTADIENIIHKTGFYHAKARNIIAASQVVIRQFRGVVPDRMADLVVLPGVGRKTANIVLHHAFGKTEGIAVDT
ncbi:MAG: endonuclease III, partial [Methanospirillum sp.]|nr:endonuclease III [Methanospirillum sp.]